jgi:hypothetical protein
MALSPLAPDFRFTAFLAIAVKAPSVNFSLTLSNESSF